MSLVLIPGLVLGSALYLRLEKRVTLAVDGRESAVTTFAATVGDLLERRGVALDEHDEVTPSPDSVLVDGSRVEVLLAREVTVVLNGVERTVHVPGSKTVREVLELINLRVERNASIQPSRGATVEDGDVIVYEAAVDVNLVADGRKREVITNAASVGYLLDSLGIVLRGRDRVEPPPERTLRNGMTIRVIRVKVGETTVEEAIPFETEVRKSDDLMVGQRRVLREGSSGLRRKVFRVRTENGQEVARTLVSTTVVREPVKRVVVEGTRQPQSQTGVASWYERTGMVAAHPTLPFGTAVNVTNLANGRSVSVVINDRGPYVDGRIIDLSDDAFARLAPLSHGTCRVTITW